MPSRCFGFLMLILLVSVTLILTSPMEAQTFNGSILGNVTDPSNAAIVGATVSVTNIGTVTAAKPLPIRTAATAS